MVRWYITSSVSIMRARSSDVPWQHGNASLLHRRFRGYPRNYAKLFKLLS